LLAAAPGTASAQQPQPPGPPLSTDERRCAGLNAAAPDAQAQACTALLGSGRYVGDNLAIVRANLGIAYARSGDYDRAIGEFDTALRINPNYTRAYISRGNAQLVKRDFERAIANFDQAVRLDPRAASSFMGRATAYDAKGDIDRAIADYDSAIRLDPNLGAADCSNGMSARARPRATCASRPPNTRMAARSSISASAV